MRVSFSVHAGRIAIRAAEKLTKFRKSLGYLGLGMMGFPMASRLLKAGYDVAVWNRTAGKATSLVDAGATPAANPLGVARLSSVIFICVTDAKSVEDVVFGQDGSQLQRVQESSSSIFPQFIPMRPVCCSTIESSERDGLDRRAGLRRHQGRRGRHACRDGWRRISRCREGPSLCFGNGATIDAYGPDRLGPDDQALQSGDRGLRHGSARGSHKLAANAGIDAAKLPEALAGGFANSIPLQLFVPRMVNGIHSPPLGHIATMLKDLDTVADVAQTTSTPVPMAALAAQLFRLAKAARGADADALEIYKLSATTRH